MGASGRPSRRRARADNAQRCDPLTRLSDFAVTFHNSGGEIIGHTWAGTTCLFPKAPSKYAAVSEDRRVEHEIRCGKCAGCVEFDRLTLARRLVAMYREFKGQLWAVIVETSLELQSSVKRRLSRIAQSRDWSAFYRIAENHLACIATQRPTNLLALSTRIGCSISFVKLGAANKNRRFRLFTRCVTLSREKLGKWTNRFYHAGLPPAEKDHWDTSQRGGIRSRHRDLPYGVIGVSGEISLQKQMAWRPLSIVRRRDRDQRMNSSPESAAGAVATVLADLMGVAKAPDLPVISGAADGRASSSVMSGFRVVSAPAGPASGRDFTARRGRLVPAPAPSAALGSRDLSLESRYQSSVHTNQRWFEEWAAKMAAKARERPPPK